MQVFIEKTKTTKQITFSGTLKELLTKLKINPQTVIVSRNSELITHDTKLKNSDEIKILSVISGG